ncbi:class I SAM-dependent methyltransferase [Candidatus Parcubacteria bacterium]|nr:class I SAM-dependent methyltransferase [Candidatus Parcubacteria bacterium]
MHAPFFESSESTSRVTIGGEAPDRVLSGPGERATQQFLEYPHPLVDLYDALHPGPLDHGDDRALYHKLAKRRQPVLELAVGTGRVARYLAGQNIPVVGLEISPNMLRQARENISRMSETAQRKISLVEGDMRDFDLGRTFPLAIVPFSAFQHLLTIENQMRVLRCIHRHLAENGHLVVDIFDPNLGMCLPGGGLTREMIGEVVHPATQLRWRIFVDARENIVEQQVLHAQWRFAELASDDQVLRQYYWRLTLRWFYRFEMQHLLERSGFAIVNLWSDYKFSPPAYGKRQVWFARKA